MCLICPNHECAHFRPFRAISHIFCPPCTMFSPSCTPDAWTNGPYMTWVIWTLVPMAPTPRGRGGATFVKVLAQSECGRFRHFGICGPHWDCHHAEWHGDLWEPRAWESLLDSRRIRSPSRRGDILLGAPPNFGSFRAAKMTPFWDPNFTPPCGQLVAPLLYAHEELGPNSRLCTQI